MRIGDIACVTNAVALNVRAGPCTDTPVIGRKIAGDSMRITGGPVNGCGYKWWQIDGNGWCADNYLERCGSTNFKNWNKFGIGLVHEGADENQQNWARELSGDKGWILLIFPGIDLNTNGPSESLKRGVENALKRGLNVVIRAGPGWGQAHYRDLSDDKDHKSYKRLADAYKRVVTGLIPILNAHGRDCNLYIQVHNEPNLCYEWYCKNPSNPISYHVFAAEYAFFFRDVADAIASIGDWRIKVGIGALAPGGNVQCGCCGSENCPGDSPGITGIEYLKAMRNAVPNVFEKMDFWASHPYPAAGIGHSFNVPFHQATPGLKYYELELKEIGRTMQVLITETGWASKRPGLPFCSEEEKALWTKQAYSELWMKDWRIMGVMPFMLADWYWGEELGYGWKRMNGGNYPVFDVIKNYRQSIGVG